MSAYEKGLKLKIRGPVHSYHLIVSPGFESFLKEEISLFNFEIIEEGKGFIRTKGKLIELLKFSFYTTLTNRIYIELGEFHVGASEELFRKASSLYWEYWVGQNTEIQVDTIVARSRFSHEGKLSETMQKAVSRRLKDCPENHITFPKMKILVRLLDNRAHIKLDVSGELQYRRGYRVSSTEAPLRESLAAGLIRWAFQGLDFEKALVYDPLCGSGSFGAEASIFLSKAGVARFRTSPLLAHPVFSPESITHEQIKAASKIEVADRVFMSDIDSSAITSANTNMAALKRLIGVALPSASQQDFFDLLPDRSAWTTRPLLCLNPPWGIRLPIETKAFYAKIIERLSLFWQGSRVLLLAPKEIKLEVQGHESLEFSSGGVKLKAYLMDL